LQNTLAQIVKEACETQLDCFCSVTERATRVICGENGRIGNLEIAGRLVKMKPFGEIVIIGDLHGDLESLVDILQNSMILQRLGKKSDTYLIFLGDYGDRGPFSAEVYYTILKLKLLFPKQIILLRGNHEGPDDLQPSPHDLPVQFQRRFGEKWEKAYRKVRELFACLYNAVVVEDQYIIIHGGLPSQAKTIKDLARAHANHPKESFLEEMLWSDPDETSRETRASPRGAGRLFGEKVTTKILKRLNVKILVRGHEPCEEGFKINHGGKILTLFSRKGPPYFNLNGAYLDFNMSQKFDNAEQMIPHIHRF